MRGGEGRQVWRRGAVRQAVKGGETGNEISNEKNCFQHSAVSGQHSAKALILTKVQVGFNEKADLPAAFSGERQKFVSYEK